MAVAHVTSGARFIPICSRTTAVLRITIAMTISVAFMMFALPRVTTAIDRHLTRRRLKGQATSGASTDGADPGQRDAPGRPRTARASVLETLHGLSGDIAVGVHPHDALTTVIDSTLEPEVAASILGAEPERTVAELIAMGRHAVDADRDPDIATMFDLLAHARVDSVFVPAAIDDIAGIIRVHQGLRHDLRAATTQATFTTRFLTWMPVAVLVMMTLASEQTRHGLFTVPVLVVLATGVALNRIGATWIAWLVGRVLRTRPDETVTLTAHLVVSLRAGRSVIESVSAWRGVTPSGDAVAASIMRGESLSHALTFLPDTAASARLAQSIHSTFRDGLAVINTIHHLLNDVRHELQRHGEIQLRRLPAQLSLPLVLCVLPSFLLLTIAPIALDSMARLGPALSPALSVLTQETPP